MFSKLPPWSVFVFALLLGITAAELFNYFGKAGDNDRSQSVAKTDSSIACNYTLTRLSGYKYARPLILAEQTCEAEKYMSLKSQLSQTVEAYKNDGTLNTASVYFKDMTTGCWMCLNENEKFNPGSLIKVPVLMTYLRMAETQPGLLDKEVVFAKAFNTQRQQVFIYDTIQLGHTYTIRELLRYLIVSSDNNANVLLWQHMDTKVFVKLVADLGLPKVDINATDYPVTSKDYSSFLNALYNGTYVNFMNSDYAFSLLSDCKFKDGLVNGIPPSIKVAHKFGEAGSDQMHELHESAIVFLNNSPYLLTVMTRGTDLKKLPAVISNISKQVFEYQGKNG